MNAIVLIMVTSSSFQQKHYRLVYNSHGSYATLIGGDHGGQDKTGGTDVDRGSKDDAEGTIQVENSSGARG